MAKPEWMKREQLWDGLGLGVPLLHDVTQPYSHMGLSHCLECFVQLITG